MSRSLQTVSLSNHVYHCLIAAPVLLVSPGNAFAIPSISVSSSHVPHASRGVRTSNDDSVSHDVGALPYPGGWLLDMHGQHSWYMLVYGLVETCQMCH